MAKPITWTANITGKGYTPCEVSISGPSTSKYAYAALRAQYPGAKVYNVRRDTAVIQEEWEDTLERSGANKGGSSAETYNTSTESSVSNFVDRTGTSMGIVLLAVVGVGIWFAWMLLPLVTLGGGLFAGYKYSSKYSQNVNFHLRMWLVLGSAILGATGGYMAGDKIHEFAGIDYSNGTPTAIITNE